MSKSKTKTTSRPETLIADARVWKQEEKKEPTLEASQLSEAKRLLSEASAEIINLRRDNSLMRTRLDMFDKCFALFNSDQQRNGVSNFGPDVVYGINKLLSAMG